MKSNEKAIEVLKEKEKKHLETIHTLKLEVAKLREGKAGTSSECQTFSEDISIPCSHCIYIATCEEELNWHLSDEHDITSDLFFDTDFPCDICGKWCRSESDLEYHQEKHEASSKSAEMPCQEGGWIEQVCEFCSTHSGVFGGTNQCWCNKGLRQNCRFVRKVYSLILWFTGLS